MYNSWNSVLYTLFYLFFGQNHFVNIDIYIGFVYKSESVLWSKGWSRLLLVLCSFSLILYHQQLWRHLKKIVKKMLSVKLKHKKQFCGTIGFLVSMLKLDVVIEIQIHALLFMYLFLSRVIYLQVFCSLGVKFTFKNINSRNPNEEYSLTVRYANDTYTCKLYRPVIGHVEMLNIFQWRVDKILIYFLSHQC